MKGKAMLLGFLSVVLAACVRFSVGYQPPVVPVRVVVHDDGNITVEGSSEFITPVGTFSIGAEYSLKGGENDLYLVLRDQNRQKDQVFKVRRDKLVMSIEGNIQFQAVANRIIIDVTNAKVHEIRFYQRGGNGKSPLSPVDVVTNYWAYVGTGSYSFAWQMLSSGFQQRNHHGDINNYIQGYKSLDLCNVEAKSVHLREATGAKAVVDAKVVYYKGAQCKQYTFLFTHILIQEDNQWKIEHVYFKK